MKKVFDFERSLLRVPGELPDAFYVKRPEAQPVGCWYFTPNSDGWHRELIDVDLVLYSSADGVFTRTVYVVVIFDLNTLAPEDVRRIELDEASVLRNAATPTSPNSKKSKKPGVPKVKHYPRPKDPWDEALAWKEIPLDVLQQADLPNLIAAWNEFCLRLWGQRPYVDPKEADTQRLIDTYAMKLTCRRLAEYAEQELGDGTALLRISGLLPAAQPTANEWDAGWEVVRRLEMRHAPQNGRAETGLSGGSNNRPAEWIPTEVQRDILNALVGVAMTADALEGALEISRSTLYGKKRKGGLTELKELGKIANDRKVGGYFRPDSPPKAH